MLEMPNTGPLLPRKRIPLGIYRRPTPRVLGGSKGSGRFLMGEVPLYPTTLRPQSVSRGRCEGPYALTPNIVELVPILGALSSRGGPFQDSVLTDSIHCQAKRVQL